MGRKHKHPEHENLERWLVSYADFITLLFATFTALFALASADLAKMKEVGESIKEGFQAATGASSIIDFAGSPEIMKGKGNDDAQIEGKTPGGEGVLDNPAAMPMMEGIPQAKKVLQQLGEEIEQINKKIGEQYKSPGNGDPNSTGGTQAKDPSKEAPRGVELAVQERGIKVSFDSSLLFEGGSAALKPQAKVALDAVGKRLKTFSGSNLIQVEGHTDSEPIASAVYPSNWELSTARASAVVRYLVSKHSYSPKTMSATGYAESRPVADNATAEGRAKNRRIDIMVFSKVVENQVDPTHQQKTEKAVVQPRKAGPKIEDQLLESQSSTGDGGPVKVILQKKGPDGEELAPQVILPKDKTGQVVTPISVLPPKGTKPPAAKPSPTKEPP